MSAPAIGLASVAPHLAPFIVPDTEDWIGAELAERHLRDFVSEAWHVVEPTTPFLPNWHLDAICDHLEAVSRGEIRNLLINIPPRFMKSLAVAVFWPVWSWVSCPSTRWLFSSYTQALSIRDSLKSRRLIDSPWFQRHWADRFRLTGDQNAKQRYENDHTGYRVATSVDGSATGEGGDCVVVDDPHNVREGESVLRREAAMIWWDEVMSTRLNDPETGSKVIVMQRIHEQDLAGHVLEQGGYEHLCLPLEYEPDRKCVTSIGFQDPRTEDGELLWPERVGPDARADYERVLGQYAYAGQMQQRPAPRQGGMFPVERFKIVKAPPCKRVATRRGWDKAGTEGGGAFTAGVKMSKLEDGSFLVEDVVRGQWSAGRREETIKQTAELDGRRVKVSVEQEPGSGGKESAEATVANLAGFVCELDRVTGDKETRAEPYAVQVEASNVLLLEGDWNKAYIEEHRSFPAGKFKDQVDAGAQVFNFLTTPKTRLHFGVA